VWSASSPSAARAWLKMPLTCPSAATDFTLKLMAKDVAMARDLAAALGVPAPTLGHVSGILSQALAALGEEADHTELYRYIEDLSKKGREREERA